MARKRHTAEEIVALRQVDVLMAEGPSGRRRSPSEKCDGSNVLSMVE
jgi:hypothetical protein